MNLNKNQIVKALKTAILVSSFSVLHPLNAAPPTENALWSYTREGVRCGYFLKDQEIESIPPWHPQIDSKLPLSLEQAILLGRTEIARRNPQYKNFIFTEVSWTPILHRSIKDRWMYVILFTIMDNSGRPIFREGNKDAVVITFDGKIVPYKEIPIASPEK